MWSMGCIFAEVLLGKPLLPGRDTVDQLLLITDLLGKPPQHVIDRIRNPRARNFLSALPPKCPCPFEAIFPAADPQALDLLRRMLAFDPLERVTTAEALRHPYFAGLPSGVCAPRAESCSSEFDFEHSVLTEADVRALVFQEMLTYHPNMKAVYDLGHLGHLMSHVDLYVHDMAAGLDILSRCVEKQLIKLE